MSQFIRFIIAGVFNTGLGYAVIFGCMYLADLPPEPSNLIGYVTGLVVSYFFHRRYTFRSTQQRKKEFVHFIAAFVVAYSANLGALTLLVRVGDVHAGISQIIAGAVYIGISYLLNKYYVFHQAKVNI